MPPVLVDDRASVRHLILNRPQKRNALDLVTMRELDSAVRAAAVDDSVRCVVVRGAGPVFSAGIDLSSLAGQDQSPGQVRAFRSELVGVMNRIEETCKPFVCQIHGVCLGMAMELALACDLRVMEEGSRCGLVEARLGLIPDVGGSARLPAVVGLGHAKELIMTGRLVDAEEAYRIGFANRLAPPGQLDEVTAELVSELGASAPRAVGLAKRLLDQVARPHLGAALEAEITAQEQLLGTEDFAEGVRASLEKRRPEFTGR